MTASNMPSYLIVAPSSCQMYSGTGTAIFDWIRFAKNQFSFHVVMDIENDSNFRLTQNFCVEHGVAFTSSLGLSLPGCIDSGIKDINALLESRDFDFIECVSWANAATNLSVLASRKHSAKLIFVPHSQPLWTLPDPKRHFMVPSAFEKMLNTSDYIFIDSPSEMKLEAFKVARQGSIHFLPLGVAGEFCYTPNIRPEPAQILCVCDCMEERKRLDLLFEVFTRIYQNNPTTRLVLGGKGSNEVPVPLAIRQAVTTLGYIDQSTLIRLYQSSSLFMLLSDYEAFGLPIAEALCCGCPVLLNDIDVLRDIYNFMYGVWFIKNSEIKHAAVVAEEILIANINREAIAKAASNAFSFSATYGRKRDIILDGGVHK